MTISIEKSPLLLLLLLGTSWTVMSPINYSRFGLRYSCLICKKPPLYTPVVISIGGFLADRLNRPFIDNVKQHDYT